MRAHDEPGAALAQARLCRQTWSNAARAVVTDVVYQGSSPTTSYAASRVTERSSCGYLDAKVCPKYVPYESPYRSTLPRRSVRITPATSRVTLAVPNRSLAWTKLPSARW